MAFGKKFSDKNKRPRRNTQSALFKRKRVCRFTAEGVEQIDYKDIDTLDQCALSASAHHRNQARSLFSPDRIYRQSLKRPKSSRAFKII